MIERKALIFNIQKYNMYDGPGVRTMVFFKGCPLRCQWCSNPEGQLRGHQVLFKQSLCVNCGACVPVCPVGIHRMTPDGVHFVDTTIECVGCRKCEEACTAAALAVVGETRTVSELMEIIEEDRPFYEASGGGVTLSGGEVLMQPEVAANLLMVCRRRGIGTAIETCGYARPEVLLKVAEFTDIILYDVKHMDSARHHELTGVRNESILSNLKLLLENRHNVYARLPLIRGLNDGERELRMLAEFLRPYREYKNFRGVDLLPYHRMGVGKYGQLGWDYALEGNLAPDDTALARMEDLFRSAGFPVVVIRH